MTKGDKIKLRAELAGKAMQGLLTGDPMWAGDPQYCAQVAAIQADAVMYELGLSLDKED